MTVGDLLAYLQTTDIPADAELVVESPDDDGDLWEVEVDAISALVGHGRPSRLIFRVARNP